MALECTQKTVLITGGARGIGRAIADRFAQEKANIIITGRNLAQLQETAAEISQKEKVQVLPLVQDVTEEASTQAVIKEALAQFGNIDVLVNNAGITKDTLIATMDSQAWHSVLETNLTGAFYCIKHITKPMLRQKSGRIINISSVIALNGNIGQANYAAAKAGLLGLTKTAAKELGRKGITVNAVAPGFITSDMTAVLPEKITQELLSKIPLKCYGNPADIANCVAFLASEQARYITGQVISVDGGMSIHT